MKKNKILFALLASACVGMAAGCGEAKYTITTKVNSKEESYITGGGKYANGKKVSLRVYPTEGCFGTETDPAQYPRLEFTRQGETTVTESFELTNLIDRSYYLYEFILNNDAENGNVGTYNVVCSCATNTAEDVSEAEATKYNVTYKIIDDDYNEIESFVKEVKAGGVAEDVTSVATREGILKWYKDKQGNNEYDFTTPVTSNLTLYSKLEDSPKAIIEGAIRGFKNTEYLEMTLSDGTSANAINYNKFLNGTEAEKKTMFFDYKNTAKKEFIISEGFYYQIEDDGYYKVDLSAAGFDMSVDKIEKFNKFFKHITELDLTVAGHKFSVEKDGETVKKFDVVIGKDELDADIVVSCAKYMVKDASDNVLYNLYINAGKIYKTETTAGVTNTIKYPESTSKVNPSTIKTMNMIKLTLDAGDETIAEDLQNLFTSMNSKFEDILKIKQGQSLREVLTGNTALNAVLKKYNYDIKRENTVITNSLDLVNPFTNSVTLTIDVTATSQVVTNAVDVLNDGGFTVTTSMTWDEETYTKTATIAAGTDVLNSLGSISTTIKNTLIKLRDLDHATLGYDSFSVNGSTGEYEFFDKDCSVPYLRVAIDETTGKITKVTYYDFENPVVDQRNTYVSTITYN